MWFRLSLCITRHGTVGLLAFPARRNRPAESSRGWMRYAVAALVAGVIAISSVLYFGKEKSADNISDAYSWVEKHLENVPDKELDEFLNTVNISTPTIAKSGSSDKIEVRKLLKDIPNAELDKFLEEMSIGTEDATLFN